jgi:hypothetical protein
MATDVASWQSFYLMVGGAAAALTGLVVVALSLQAKAIIGDPLFRDRALGSLQSLLGGVALSAAALVPDQPPLALGVEIGLIAAFFVGRVASAALLFRSVGARVRRRPGRRWLVEWIAWSLWLTLFVASAIEVAIEAPGGFYLLAIAMVWMLGLNVWNAWVLIEEVAAQPSASR